MITTDDLEKIDVADLPMLRTEVPGPASRALTTREQRHMSPGLSALAIRSGIAVRFGRGALLCDVDDNVFIDFSSGTVVTVTGFSHPRVVSAITAELERFIHSYDYTNEARVEFLDRYNAQLITPSRLEAEEDVTTLKGLIYRHLECTDS